MNPKTHPLPPLDRGGRKRLPAPPASPSAQGKPGRRFGIYIALSILLLVTGAGWVQGGTWNWLTGNNLRNVKFWPGTNEGWAIGQQGLILHTTDGGDHWEVQNSNTQQDLFGLFFLNQNNGWVTGGYKTCLRTRDGGRNWQVEHTEPSGFSHFKGVCFLDSVVGWVVGPYDSILKSTDGGVTWNGIDRGIMQYYLSITFPEDSLHGWTASPSHMTKTTDGGTTWRDTVLPGFGGGQCIDFGDTLHEWSVGPGWVARTTDGGTTWISSNPTSAFLYGVSFFDTLRGEAVGGENTNLATILRTTDGGISWASQTLTNNFDFYGVSSPESTKAYVVGQSGSILKTTNGGIGWQILRNTDIGGEGSGLLGASFFDANHGWAVGTAGVVYTTNGRTVWRRQSCPASSGIDAEDLDHAWACGGGQIYSTRNGGTTWTIQHTDTTRSSFYAISFADTLHGISVGGGTSYPPPQSWYITRSTSDGGITWQGVGPTYNVSPLSGVSLLKGGLGWACGGMNYILHTTDGGLTWAQQNLSINNFNSITFLDSLHGWACGQSGHIIWTTDGGNTWNIGNSGVTTLLHGCAFYDNLNGFACGDGGQVLKTTDGGRNWVTDTSKVYANLTAVCALDSTHVWTVGSFGMVLGWGEAGITGTERTTEVRGQRLESKLGQSYPNPTTGIASFEYELGKAGKVRVKVYNIAGQAVRTLVEGMETAGRHVVTWDGKDTSGRKAGSGTYFYCLEAGDRKAVRKMVIIK